MHKRILIKVTFWFAGILLVSACGGGGGGGDTPPPPPPPTTTTTGINWSAPTLIDNLDTDADNA